MVNEQRAKQELAEPVPFLRHVLGADPWPKQQEIACALAANSRVAVKACHASGKTWLAARLALWFLVTRRGIVVTTAPTWDQVRLLLWNEIHKALQEAKAHSGIVFPEPTQTELRLAPDCYAIGLSTNEGVRFQGFHAPNILVILDEAPGVRPDIWEAIEGARAGGDVRILALGNPTIPGGAFYDAFTSNRDGWATFTISAFDTPNLGGVTLPALLEMDDAGLAVSPRPYLTTRRWVREIHAEHGPLSPYYQARVDGNFPEQAEDALISLAWIEAAAMRDPEPVPGVSTAHDGDIVVGVDVAGPGEDETVLIVRRGSTLLHEQAWKKPDPRGELLAALAPWRHRIRVVNVDSAGIGYYLGLHLQDQGIATRLVNVGEATTIPERYKNLKAELYWGLRMRFQAGDVRGPMSELLKQQLSTIRYKPNERGQTVIESKEDAVKRGVKSPDRAEALMLAFAGDGAVDVVGSELPSRPPVRMPRMEVGA